MFEILANDSISVPWDSDDDVGIALNGKTLNFLI